MTKRRRSVATVLVVSASGLVHTASAFRLAAPHVFVPAAARSTRCRPRGSSVSMSLGDEATDAAHAAQAEAASWGRQMAALTMGAAMLLSQAAPGAADEWSVLEARLSGLQPPSSALVAPPAPPTAEAPGERAAQAASAMAPSLADATEPEAELPYWKNVGPKLEGPVDRSVKLPPYVAPKIEVPAISWKLNAPRYPDFKPPLLTAPELTPDSPLRKLRFSAGTLPPDVAERVQAVMPTQEGFYKFTAELADQLQLQSRVPKTTVNMREFLPEAWTQLLQDELPAEVSPELATAVLFTLPVLTLALRSAGAHANPAPPKELSRPAAVMAVASKAAAAPPPPVKLPAAAAPAKAETLVTAPAAAAAPEGAVAASMAAEMAALREELQRAAAVGQKLADRLTALEAENKDLSGRLTAMRDPSTLARIAKQAEEREQRQELERQRAERQRAERAEFKQKMVTARAELSKNFAPPAAAAAAPPPPPPAAAAAAPPPPPAAAAAPAKARAPAAKKAAAGGGIAAAVAAPPAPPAAKPAAAAPAKAAPAKAPAAKTAPAAEAPVAAAAAPKNAASVPGDAEWKALSAAQLQRKTVAELQGFLTARGLDTADASGAPLKKPLLLAAAKEYLA